MPTPKAASSRGGGFLPGASGEVRARHVAALIVVQLCYAGYHVISKVALKGGVNRYVFCAYRDGVAVAALFAFDLAVRCARACRGPSDHPAHARGGTSHHAHASLHDRAGGTVPWGPMSVLALLGVFLNQLFFLKGLALTSPVVAGALQLCIPVFTWLVALALGDESVSLGTRDGRLKLAGVALCVTGALITSFHQGDVAIPGRDLDRRTARAILTDAADATIADSDTDSDASRAYHRAVGVCFLLGNCACMAAYLTLQQRVLARYPHPREVTHWTYALGGAMMAAAAAAAEPPWLSGRVSQWILTGPEWRGVLYGGVVASGFNYTVMTWVNGAVGASVVAMFLPLQPVAAAALGWVFLGDAVYSGTLAGGAAIAAGLASVTAGRAAGAKDAKERARTLLPRTRSADVLQ